MEWTMIEFYWEGTFELKKGKHRSRMRPRTQEGFKCCHCHTYVSCEPLLAGVLNRNHCPYCLWSRHLDLEKPGDRLAACREKMEPVGLTLKKSTRKYGSGLGELMVIHLCQECWKVSINRIAADDLADRLGELYERSLEMNPQTKAHLNRSGVEILEAKDRAMVSARLFGM
jgi:hypothetical protein